MGRRIRMCAGRWLVMRLFGGHQVFLTVLLLLVARFEFRQPGSNELDYLPLARQAVDPGWLPQDWYLNQPAGHHLAFDCTVGWLLRMFPFETAMFIGRMLAYLLFALALQALARALGLQGGWMGLALLGFLPNQSLVAGEWMVGGLETKPFAYACCILAVAALLQGRLSFTFLLLGLTITFHVLVGLYATFCAIATLLFLKCRCALDWRSLIRPFCWFLLAAAPGFWVIFHYCASLER